MKTTVTQWAAKAAGTGALALLLAAPAGAQTRGDWNRNGDARNGQMSDQRDGNRSADGHRYRENERVNATGKVSSFNRERDGYRVQLDRGDSFWIPRSALGNRERDLRAGISISLGGVFRGGSVYVDAVTWPNAGYANGFVRGVVDRVDRRAGTIWLRDEASGRTIVADVNARQSIRDLRRGDRVELTGHWVRGGNFSVARIDNIRGRR